MTFSKADFAGRVDIRDWELESRVKPFAVLLQAVFFLGTGGKHIGLTNEISD